MTDDQGSAPRPSEAGILSFLETCDAFYPADAVDASIEQQRLWYNALCAQFSPPHPAGLTTLDETVRDVPIRRYRPAKIRTETRLLYLHGGGFVVGSLDSHDSICAEIADRVGAELVAVDYRLAPDHVWPSQHEDCLAVLRALVESGHKIVVIGDSAGGNLAAGLCVGAVNEGFSEAIIGQALIYPALGGDLVSGSYVEMAQAPGLTTADVGYYRDILKAPAEDPVAHALCAGDEIIRRLPPAFITAAHFDPLRDDGRDYAARLAKAGVEVWYREEPQMVHAWLRARHMSKGAEAGFHALCIAISKFAGSL